MLNGDHTRCPRLSRPLQTNPQTQVLVALTTRPERWHDLWHVCHKVCEKSSKIVLWFAKTLADFEINDIAYPPASVLL